MGVSSIFTIKSNDKNDVKLQLAKLKKKLKFEDQADIATEFKIQATQDLQNVLNFLEQFGKKVSPNLVVGFNKQTRLYSTNNLKHYLTVQEAFEKDPNISSYSLSFKQPSSKTYDKSISFQFDRNNLPKHFSPWLENNECQNAISVYFSNHEYGAKKDFDALIPYFQETLAVFNIPFVIKEREEYGKIIRYIPSFENNEIYFQDAKLNDENFHLFIFLKKSTPSTYFNSLLSLSFFDPIEVSSGYFGNYVLLIKNLIAKNERTLFLWPDTINIYPVLKLKWIKFPADKMIPFILDCEPIEADIRVSVITTIPKELFESEENDVTGEINLFLKKGDVVLSFHMRGYVDIEPVFAKEFGITFTDTFLG